MLKRTEGEEMQLEDISNILFTTLAPKLLYKDARETLVLSKPLLDISRAILMLSYVYRPIFREKFLDALHHLYRDIKGNPMLFVYAFADELNKNYSSYKFLIYCSFLSELHFFLIENETGQKENYYIKQSEIAFMDIFGLTFKEDFNKNQRRWIHLFRTASKIAKKFNLLKPFMYERTLKEPGRIPTSCRDTTAVDEIENNQLPTNIANPGSSQTVNMDDNLPKRNFQTGNEVKSIFTPAKMRQVIEDLLHIHNINKTPRQRCLLFDHLLEQCSLREAQNLGIYCETKDSPALIESPNFPTHDNYCCSASTSENSKKRGRFTVRWE